MALTRTRTATDLARKALLALGLSCLVGSTVFCQDPTYASVRLVPSSSFCAEGYSKVALFAGGAEIARVLPKSGGITATVCDGSQRKDISLQPSTEGDTSAFGVAVLAAKDDATLGSCIASGDFTRCVVARRTLSYQKNRGLLLEVGLDAACAGADARCQGTSRTDVPGYLATCVAGACGNGNLSGREGECVDAVCDDNALPCTAGEKRACGSVNPVGICKLGQQTCNARGRWDACAGEVKPTSVDCTSLRDNNCDGQPDATSSLCKCEGGLSPGQTEACESHPSKDGRGICKSGVRSCAASSTGYDPPALGLCTGASGPASTDLCGDAIDNDCDGVIDNNCPCNSGEQRSCGPVSLNNIGVCRAGTQSCADGKWPSSCVGAVDPKVRDCTSPLDNDCNGIADNREPGCMCDGSVPVGLAQACDAHPGLDGVGLCRAGARTCSLDTTGKPVFGACSGSIGPSTDGPGFCDGKDNDCDGIPDQGCGCVTGSKQDCGPVDLDGKGICKKGQQECSGGGYGACVGAVNKGERDCTSAADNDCNGIADNQEAACRCGGTVPIGQSIPCDTHPNKDGIGICRAGTQMCISNGAAAPNFGACTGGVGPGVDGPPASCDNVDNDCDGVKDNGCTCANGQTQPCGVSNVGICKYGTQTCSAGAWGSCVGAVPPGPKDCASLADNDCNGTVDSLEPVCTCPIDCQPTTTCETAFCDPNGNCVRSFRFSPKCDPILLQ